MAAPKPLTASEKLRAAADSLYLLAERAETPQRTLTAVQLLHNEIEEVAGDVRAVVRGRAFT